MFSAWDLHIVILFSFRFLVGGESNAAEGFGCLKKWGVFGGSAAVETWKDQNPTFFLEYWKVGYISSKNRWWAVRFQIWVWKVFQTQILSNRVYYICPFSWFLKSLFYGDWNDCNQRVFVMFKGDIAKPCSNVAAWELLQITCQLLEENEKVTFQ